MTPTGSGRRRPGQLETEIMTVLDAAVRPLTPGEVRDALESDGSLSYSTVVTTLTRLFEKGAVARRRDGRAFRYGALSAPAGLVADRMSRLMAVEPDRATVLRRFVSNLSADDERLLRELLDEDPSEG
ncbi:BlaI/MecI/CopY family transcriptional regulator [Actinoplanes sp. Pm04-4]|uniref:BlaI/MecI/CopY family transcriptional regulator n=1 Tax=Paractinoplanes pyxinae TaxID=2997416 RepID=A0ABT4B591_9ACTN|nr:BlaI/MecI/CopY family transcriptional regulator [Actinoplanes pyxinae]MCY1141665.1 BlaI/MecI/CopY family transcriptional regulator [Actinoplanes pyxinae]